MIPKIAHFVWLGKQSERNQIGEESAGRLYSTGWEVMLHSDSSICQQLGINCVNYVHSTLAGSSNLVRLYALEKYGGVYFDFDVEVLKDPTPLLEYDEFIARQPDGVFCNAVMGAKPGSPWIKRQIELLYDFQKHDAAHACHIIEQAPSENLTVLPTHFFYPWGHDEKPDRSKITDETYCVHHWEGSWLK